MGVSHGGTRRFGLFLKGSMDMKYLILAVALVATLATADFAEARCEKRRVVQVSCRDSNGRYAHLYF